MSPTRSRAAVLLAAVTIALTAVACRTGGDVVMWGPCTPGNDPTGTDGRYALVCQDGEWIPVMTVDEFVRINGGEQNVVIAPLPKRPRPVTTTTTSTSTTAAPAPAPTVAGLSTSAGPAAGGTSVTITGTNLTGATSVTFGGTPATGVTVNSATSITATTPAHAAGAVDVAVATAGGTATLTGSYTYVAAPTLTSISPSAGPVAGGTSVTITGTNFTGTTSVTFGGTAATSFTVNSATSITATTPAQTVGAVDVAVTTAGGTATLTGSYTYVAAPTISSVGPDMGPSVGGWSVVINGTNLTGATSVTFGGIPATSFTVVSQATIVAIAPAHPVGPVDIAVTTVGGSATISGAFAYVII